MRKKYLLLMVITFGVWLGGCQINEEPKEGQEDVVQNETDTGSDESQKEREIDSKAHGEFAFERVKVIKERFPSRIPFTTNELATANWIVEELKAMGFNEDQIEKTPFPLQSFGGVSEWFSPVDFLEMLINNEPAEVERTDYSQNVILTIPGESDKTIVVGAHYDVHIGAGISDNASGISLLLESAARMKEIVPYHTIKYVFFGAEEIGLVGADYFVQSLTEEEREKIVLMINADVLFDGPDLVFATGYSQPADDTLLWGGEVHQNELTESIKELALELNEVYNLELISSPEQIFVPTDQLSFIEVGIPVLVFLGVHQMESHISLDVANTLDDNFDFLNDNFPGRMERSLHQFSIFLEQILLQPRI